MRPVSPAPTETGAAQPAGLAAWERVYGAGGSAPEGVGACVPADGGRPAVDSRAAWRRWHPSGIEAELPPGERDWYAWLERARVETLAGRELPGMALNLTLDADGAGHSGARLHALARRVFATAPGHETLVEAAHAAETPGTPVEPGAPRSGKPPWWAPWRRRAAAVPADAPGALPPDEQLRTQLQGLRPWLHDPASFLQQARPLLRRLVDAAGRPAPEAGECARAAPLRPAERGEGRPQQAPAGEQGAPLSARKAAPATRHPGYAVFSDAWDEVLPASALLAADARLHLPGLSAAERQRARRLARRLQRRLLAARQRHWAFDLESGQLDGRRLSRLIAGRPPYAVFREEAPAPVPEACVSLLVDQSGSMRGQPQWLSAQAIDLCVETLECCGLRCEVLGYTTRYGAENPVHAAWRQAGAPAAPGRLNALRHIVHKAAEMPWRHCRASLSLLLREDLGRENIDGEALDWAARRLLARPEPRKLLVVLGDGAPYDAATAGANGRGFLESHLHRVVEALESMPLRLAAIGTGAGIGRFYGDALILRRPEDIADVLFDRLGDWLTAPR